ncbi:hypothetical protein PM082_018349 [Marasmius tenuissimus]|nr:hypothetical protein PM082_018349 [Marasmius tenuissimus]
MLPSRSEMQAVDLVQSGYDLFPLREAGILAYEGLRYFIPTDLVLTFSGRIEALEGLQPTGRCKLTTSYSPPEKETRPQSAWLESHRGRGSLLRRQDSNLAELVEAATSLKKFWTVFRRFSGKSVGPSEAVSAEDLRSVFEPRMNRESDIPESFDQRRYHLNETWAGSNPDTTEDRRQNSSLRRRSH